MCGSSYEKQRARDPYNPDGYPSLAASLDKGFAYDDDDYGPPPQPKVPKIQQKRIADCFPPETKAFDEEKEIKQ